MLKDLKKLQVLMDKKQKKQMAALVVMMIIGALLEMMSITLVIPVVTAVIQPDVLDKYGIVRFICSLLHIRTTMQFTIVSMIALILIFIAKDAFCFGSRKECIVLSIPTSFRRRSGFCEAMSIRTMNIF